MRTDSRDTLRDNWQTGLLVMVIGSSDFKRSACSLHKIGNNCFHLHLNNCVLVSRGEAQGPRHTGEHLGDEAATAATCPQIRGAPGLLSHQKLKEAREVLHPDLGAAGL